jgi:cytochrome c556|tara:strand:+ start:86 stop:517 length:432 start_codon:yes stop_codon:yes gene_type:complete
LSAILSSSAFAQNAEDIIKYRINIMKSLGNHISIIAANLKGKVSINEDILPHSQSILLTLSSINIEKIFPINTQASDSPKTKSLDSIWVEKELFQKSMLQSIEKTKDLVKAAESGNNQNIAKSLGALGKSCGACHDKFRKKKN